MNNRTRTTCRHCDRELTWERISTGTLICPACGNMQQTAEAMRTTLGGTTNPNEPARGTTPPYNAYYIQTLRETIARLEREIAALKADRLSREGLGVSAVVGFEAGEFEGNRRADLAERRLAVAVEALELIHEKGKTSGRSWTTDNATHAIAKIRSMT